MTKKDWYEAGDQIRNLVQDAVDSGDFSQLSKTVSHVVNETMNGVGDVLRDSLGNIGRTDETDGADAGKELYRERTVRERRRASERIYREMDEKRQQKEEPQALTVRKRAPGLFVGNLLKWSGYSFGSMFGISTAILAVVSAATGVGMAVPIGLLGTMCAGSVAAGLKGREIAGLAHRFRRYTEVLGSRTYCLIEELANASGKDAGFVRRDLKKMIRRGFFPQGYMDQKETCLITDRATYQQYLTTQEAYVTRRMQTEMQAESAGYTKSSVSREDAAHQGRENGQEYGNDREDTGRQKTEASEKNLTPECRELLREGEGYIQHIHACNDRIMDERISEKLDRLESVVTRIFAKAKSDPDVVGDLKKMMSYYLPTTKKLQDAYCELDGQPSGGQNIESMKREIEETLDTLNSAFEKLFDDLFEEKAWDISSDISVLNTMLAQEGLTGDGFPLRDRED